jgi:thymidylate synthase
MNNLDTQYQNLLREIIHFGVEKKDRTGTGTISVFGRQIRHKMSEGFPLLTTKKMHWKSIVTELLWFLRGDTNIKYLVDNGCHIWNGDCYKNFVKRYYKEIFNYETGSHNRLMSLDEFILNIKTDDEFAEKWGELGPIYGKQWRSWRSSRSVGDDTFVGGYFVKDEKTDQIANLISELKTNPDSRRLMVNAWNVGEVDHMVLPPCHYGFQVYTRELSWEERHELAETKYQIDDTDDVLDKEGVPTRAISLMWNQRSVDTFLGLPFNIASYGLLLEIIAKEVNMVPDELIGNLGDVHLYSNHIEQAKEQIGRPYTQEERIQLLKEAMGQEAYDLAVSELMPFGGGLSEYYDHYKIPHSTRESFPLPKLVHMKTEAFYKSLSENQSLYGHIDPKDFQLENYQSHPAIKATLSN